MHTDDTTVPILHEGHCRQGRLWTYFGDGNHPFIAYDYTPTRSAQGPLGWLGKWQGFLQADAYAGYDSPTLKLRAESLGESEWKELVRPRRYEVATEARAKPANVKERIIAERDFENLRLRCEHVAEICSSVNRDFFMAISLPGARAV